MQLLYLQDILYCMNIKRELIFVSLLITCLQVHSQVADFRADTLEGCGNLTVQFTDLSTDATSWQWDFDGDNSVDSEEQNPVFNYNDFGVYTVSLTINNTISEVKNNYVTVYPNPDSTFLFKDTLGLGTFNYVFRNLRQPLEEIVTYNRDWRFDDGFTASGRTIIRTFPDTGTYIVNLKVSIDGFPGCQSDLSRRVLVKKEVFIPNIFTPNNDGENDLFIVRYNGIDKLRFRVYSRYGNILFKSDTPVIVWDGITLSGQKLNPGVYYYTISSEDGEVNRTGFIHLYL